MVGVIWKIILIAVTLTPALLAASLGLALISTLIIRDNLNTIYKD